MGRSVPNWGTAKRDPGIRKNPARGGPGSLPANGDRAQVVGGYFILAPSLASPNPPPTPAGPHAGPTVVTHAAHEGEAAMAEEAVVPEREVTAVHKPAGTRNAEARVAE